MLDKITKVQTTHIQSKQEFQLYSSTGSTNLTQAHIYHVDAMFQKSNMTKLWIKRSK